MQYSLDLEPGTYLVEAVSKSSGNLVIQEVIRTVPEKLVDSPIYGRRCREFTIDQDSGSVIWPVISLSFASPVDNLEKVGGGQLSFDSANRAINTAPTADSNIDSFELMDAEVTAAQFRALIRVLPADLAESDCCREAS